jgi:hypothetical protein
MRVDNRIAQVPPVRTRQPDNEATSRSPADNGRNHTRGELPTYPNRTRASAGGPSQGGNSPVALAVTAMSSLIAILAAEAAAAGAPHTGLEGEPVAGAIAAAEATQTSTSPVSCAAAMMPVAESRKFGATNPHARTTSSLPSLHGFAIYFSWRNSNYWGHQVRCEARLSTMAQMLCPLHRKRWWQ